MKPLSKIYGDCEGPCGFPMRSEVAREVEAALKQLPAECKALLDAAGGIVRRSIVPKQFDLHKGERDDVSLITTDALDRDREVVIPDGADWSQFQRAGMPVTFAHQYDKLPIGRALWVKASRQPNGWLARTHYQERPPEWKGDWFPDAVWHLVQSGSLRGKSIGFIPLEYRKATMEEIKGRPELAQARGIIPRWLALEYAVAAVQSNPDALVQEVAKAKAAGFPFPASALQGLGIIVADELPGLDWTSVCVPQAEGKEEPPQAPLLRSEIAARIRQATEEAIARIPAMAREAIEMLKGRV